MDGFVDAVFGLSRLVSLPWPPLVGLVFQSVKYWRGIYDDFLFCSGGEQAGVIGKVEGGAARAERGGGALGCLAARFAGLDNSIF